MIVTYCSSGVPVDYTALHKTESKIICAGCRCRQRFRCSSEWVWCFCSTMFFVTQMLFAPWYLDNLLCRFGKPPLYQIVVSSYALTLNSMCDLVQTSSSQACLHQYLKPCICYHCVGDVPGSELLLLQHCHFYILKHRQYPHLVQSMLAELDECSTCIPFGIYCFTDQSLFLHQFFFLSFTFLLLFVQDRLK